MYEERARASEEYYQIRHVRFKRVLSCVFPTHYAIFSAIASLHIPCRSLLFIIPDLLLWCDIYWAHVNSRVIQAEGIWRRRFIPIHMSASVIDSWHEYAGISTGRPQSSFHSRDGPWRPRSSLPVIDSLNLVNRMLNANRSIINAHRVTPLLQQWIIQRRIKRRDHVPLSFPIHNLKSSPYKQAIAKHVDNQSKAFS
jgi:hypothetical protein